MKKLIITANPSSKGFIHTIADKLKELSQKSLMEVEILDLYKTDLKQDYLRFEEMSDHPVDDVTKKLQEKIIWADEIVFVFPIWWGDCPAIMKNFIDSNFTPGFAFNYVNGKSVGLLKGKSARIIATSGAPSFFYKVLLHIQFFWNMNRIGFCGLKQKSFTVFGNIENSNTDKNKYLSELENLI